MAKISRKIEKTFPERNVKFSNTASISLKFCIFFCYAETALMMANSKSHITFCGFNPSIPYSSSSDVTASNTALYCSSSLIDNRAYSSGKGTFSDVASPGILGTPPKIVNSCVNIVGDTFTTKIIIGTVTRNVL